MQGNIDIDCPVVPETCRHVVERLERCGFDVCRRAYRTTELEQWHNAVNREASPTKNRLSVDVRNGTVRWFGQSHIDDTIADVEKLFGIESPAENAAPAVGSGLENEVASETEVEHLYLPPICLEPIPIEPIRKPKERFVIDDDKAMVIATADAKQRKWPVPKFIMFRSLRAVGVVCFELNGLGNCVVVDRNGDDWFAIESAKNMLHVKSQTSMSLDDWLVKMRPDEEPKETETQRAQREPREDPKPEPVEQPKPRSINEKIPSGPSVQRSLF